MNNNMNNMNNMSDINNMNNMNNISDINDINHNFEYDDIYQYIDEFEEVEKKYLSVSISNNDYNTYILLNNMDLNFNELFIAFSIFDTFAIQNQKIFDEIKPIIYYNNYLEYYDYKQFFILDNNLNNNNGWIFISDNCKELNHESIYNSFSYENINDFIKWKKNIEKSDKNYSNIIILNFKLDKKYYVIYKNNLY
jgi:hypothetical protein